MEGSYEEEVMPWYRREGKILYPMTDEEFAEGLENGHFVQKKHRGLGVLLWLTALRISEALELRREQFRIVGNTLYIDTGIRKKKRKFTRDGRPRKLKPPDPLPIPLAAPYIEELLWAIENTKPNERIWPYTTRTGYNIVRRAWKYPHFFRLTRITDFIDKGYRMHHIKSWTTLSAAAIDAYVGLVELKKMGESLSEKRIKSR